MNVHGLVFKTVCVVGCGRQPGGRVSSSGEVRASVEGPVVLLVFPKVIMHCPHHSRTMSI